MSAKIILSPEEVSESLEFIEDLTKKKISQLELVQFLKTNDDIYYSIKAYGLNSDTKKLISSLLK